MTVWTINQKFQAVGAPPPDAGPSETMLRVAEMFGIGLDESYEVTLYDGLRLDVRPGDVVFVTGPSGGGKSVLVRRLEEAIRAAAGPGARLVNLAAIDLPAGRPVIDLMRKPLERALRVLSLAGLADAFSLLRTAAELSDGQRYRLRLARAVEALSPPQGAFASPAEADGTPPPEWRVLVADEFCSTLDRLCARAVAYRVRRLATTEGVTVLAASAHDDLVEDLAPDVLVVKHAGDRVEVRYADPSRTEGGHEA
jgi:ABC-type ATPase with predicted acetyltransferase domain